MSMGLLAGRVAIVTGAGRGIGTSIAHLFAGEGAKVAVHYHTSGEPGHLLANEIGGIALKADLTNREQAERLVADAIDVYGRIDILINTAASFAHGELIENDSWETYVDEFSGVLGATFHITHAVLPHMKAAGYGRIVNFGATLIQRPAATDGAHISAKAAVLGFTRTLAREVGPSGITVNMIHPGMTLTEHTLSLPQDVRDRVADQTPLRRLAEPDDVAKVALFFASDLAGFVTGAGLAPDGGLAVI